MDSAGLEKQSHRLNKIPYSSIKNTILVEIEKFSAPLLAKPVKGDTGKINLYIEM